MGNCQAIDNATLVIQHPTGKVEKLYFPVSAQQIMKTNPGHYVALILTTTTVVCSSSASASVSAVKNEMPLRVTRIKLLRPTDTLLLGHVYRLVTSQEVMKGLRAKKQGYEEKYGKLMTMTGKPRSDFEEAINSTELEKPKQVTQKRSKLSKDTGQGGAPKSRAWQPSLKSISEAAN